MSSITSSLNVNALTKKRKRPASVVPNACAAVAAKVKDDVNLDDIFGGLRAKKAAAAEAAAKASASRAAAAAAEIRASRAVEALEAAGRAANSGARPESPVPLRFDQELGVRVFAASALRIGAGEGSTKDCPFDCECCY